MLTPSFEKSGGGPSECFNLAPSLEQSGGPSSIHLLPLFSYLTSGGPSTSIKFYPSNPRNLASGLSHVINSLSFSFLIEKR